MIIGAVSRFALRSLAAPLAEADTARILAPFQAYPGEGTAMESHAKLRLLAACTTALALTCVGEAVVFRTRGGASSRTGRETSTATALVKRGLAPPAFAASASPTQVSASAVVHAAMRRSFAWDSMAVPSPGYAWKGGVYARVVQPR